MFPIQHHHAAMTPRTEEEERAIFKRERLGEEGVLFGTKYNLVAGSVYIGLCPSGVLCPPPRLAVVHPMYIRT